MKKNLWASLLFILLLQLSHNLSAQNYLIDSLEQKLQRAPSDSARVMILSELVFNTKNVDTLKATTYSKMALQTSYNVHDPRIKATAYRIAGVLAESYYKHDAALKYLYEGLAFITNRSDLFSQFLNATIRMDIGNSYLYQGNLSSAIPYYLESQRFMEEKQANNPILVFLYINMSNTYYLSGLREKGLLYSTKAVEQAEKIKNKRAMAHAYAHRGIAEFASDHPNLVMAQTFIDKAKQYGGELKDKLVIADCHSFQSALYRHNGNNVMALEESKKSVSDYLDVHNFLFAGEETLTMARIKSDLGKTQDAYDLFNEAMRIGYQVNCAFLKRAALKGLGRTSEKLGKIPHALDYYRKYQRLNDSLMRADEKTQIYIAETQHQSHQQKEQIAALLKEKQVHQLQIRQNNLYRKLMIVAIIGSAGIVILGFMYVRGKQKIIVQQNELQKKRITALEKDRQYIVVQSLLQGQEEERSRLARDIHDGLGSILSSVKHTLTSMKGNVLISGEHVSVFNKSVDLIDYSMKELRRVAHNMMPEALIRFGLKEALNDFCQSLSSDKLKIEFITLNFENRLDSPKEIVVYRLVQELITNALKHAYASKILVQLVRDEKMVTLTVEDDGVGFDSSLLKTSKGAGWTNIKSRVEYLNGKLELDTQPGSGTSVIIEFYA